MQQVHISKFGSGNLLPATEFDSLDLFVFFVNQLKQNSELFNGRFIWDKTSQNMWIKQCKCLVEKPSSGTN